MIKNTLSIQTLIRQSRALVACAVAAGSIYACSDSEDDADQDSTTEALEPAENFSFFVTSTTHDGNLGGLDGEGLDVRIRVQQGPGQVQSQRQSQS